MVSDPRCPECTGKVSSTATWCMHCGADFPSAIDADSGRPVQDRADGEAAYEESTDGGSSDAQTVGFLVAVFGLITLPFVTPPGVTLLYVTAAVVAGLYAARQSSLGQAASRGGFALAVAPLAIWTLSLALSGPGDVSFTALLGPLAYALVVSALGRSAQTVG